MDKRWLVVAAVVSGVALFVWSDAARFLDLAVIKARQSELDVWRSAHPVGSAMAALLVYVAVTALSLPGAMVMTLAMGAVFGLGLGTLIVSFASTIGATLAFLASRLLFRDWVQTRFGDRLAAINAGVRKDGGFYLFTLRLVPVVPFAAGVWKRAHAPQGLLDWVEKFHAWRRGSPPAQERPEAVSP
jgi:uncharacterized membrane protein YdjX (TVP38/TMEM64 family)